MGLYHCSLVLLIAGALFAWVGIVGVFAWGGSDAAQALPTGNATWLFLLAPPIAGVTMFHVAIRRLNRQPARKRD